jgi:hypothetical protein
LPIILTANAGALGTHVEPYGSEEHGQRHDCDVYDDPDRQYCEFSPHIHVLPFCVITVGRMFHVSRKSIANMIIATLIATEIVNIVRSLIIFIPFLSVSPS